jgi:membrane protease subunit HflK
MNLKPSDETRMNTTVKTAVLTTSLNICLTLFKFVLVAVTGSQAILAEAWHSFTDIATSAMVVFALFQSNKSFDSEKQIRVKDREMIVSIIIGMILLLLSVTLIIQVIRGDASTIDNAVVAGIVFILFSFFSYVISIFETQIGHQENSISLVADGNHARADMAASLITGLALLLYPMGINLDRIVAALIAGMILTYAIDTFVNVSRMKQNKDQSFSIIRTIGMALLNAWHYIEHLPKKSQAARVRNASIGIMITAFVLAYLSTGIYRVDYREQACAEHLGERLPTVGPGMHWVWPWPLGRVRIQDVTTIQEIHIGNISINKSTPLLWTKKHGTEEPFISGDQNFVYPYVSIHYRIKNIQMYIYEHSQPVKLMEEFAYQTLSRLLAIHTFDHITGSHRRMIVKNMHHKLQKKLDQFKTGIQVLSVHFKDVHPPISVADAFERVVASYQYKQNQVNRALGYENSVVPDARGDASKIMAEAHTYQLERQQSAKSSANQFLAIYPNTKEKKNIVKNQAYYQNMKESLGNRSLIVIDAALDPPDYWMEN